MFLEHFSAHAEHGQQQLLVPTGAPRFRREETSYATIARTYAAILSNITDSIKKGW
jgi:hypothetical protein